MAKRTIVITGCSSGFGRRTALELASRGWRVFATVRKDADRESLYAEAHLQHCQENITPLLCDITLHDQVVALVEDVSRLLHAEAVDEAASTGPLRLDALLNNAGTAYGGPIEIMPLEDLRAQFEINVIAHVRVVQAFLPLLRVAYGTIINVSSISGRITVPVMGPYSASKYALEAISDALRLEMRPFGVHVVLVEPSSSATNIWETSLRREQQQLGQHIYTGPYQQLLQRAEKSVQKSSKSGFPIQRFADTIVHILERPHPRARYVVPGSASLLLFVRRFLPDRLFDFFIHILMRW